MTVEIITNGLNFSWSEIGNTVNIRENGSGEVVTAGSIADKSTLRDFKGYVKRWLKDNDRFNDDGYLLTRVSREFWK
jgi:hypothetical protein